MRRLLLAALLLTAAFPARSLAEEAADKDANAAKADPDAEAAKGLVKQYLDTAVKAAAGARPKPADVSKKLEAEKKLIHPKTLELIADQEKRKTVTIGLAAWHFAKKDYYVKSYELGEVKPGALGTYVVDAQEKNWRVEEGGEDADPEPTSYLVGKFKGKWYLVDKFRNATFDNKAIKAGYKGYFDEQPKKDEAAATEGDAK